MPTETTPAEPFQREDRYIVIKRSDMERLPIDQRRNFAGRCRALHDQMFIAGAPARSFLVVESDWPEYEPVWRMIERRMAGQPPVTAAEELEAVLHWRGKHTQAIRERDALQQRLNAADQRIDELTGLLSVMTTNYACCLEAGYDRITRLGGDCDSVEKMLTDNPDYAKAIAAIRPTKSGAAA